MSRKSVLKKIIKNEIKSLISEGYQEKDGKLVLRSDYSGEALREPTSQDMVAAKLLIAKLNKLFSSEPNAQQNAIIEFLDNEYRNLKQQYGTKIDFVSVGNILRDVFQPHAKNQDKRISDFANVVLAVISNSFGKFEQEDVKKRIKQENPAS